MTNNDVVFCDSVELLKLNQNETYSFGNINIVDLFQTTSDNEIIKPKHLRYFKKPKQNSYPMDLDEGYESYIHRKTEFPHSMLCFIEKYLMKDNCENVEPEITTKICANRSTLIQLMSLPILRYSANFTVNVTKFMDGIYLSLGKEETYHSINGHHFKFQQFCFAASPDAEPITNVPVDENVQWWCIFRAQLKNFDIIYSAEVVGVDNEEVEDLSNMDEINACNFVMLRLINRHMRFDIKLKTLFQATLANVKDLYTAQKKSGIIYKPMQRVDVKSLIPGDPLLLNKCFRYLFNFFSLLEKEMSTVDCPHTVYQFRHDPAEKCFKMKIFNGKNENSFLGEDFIQHLLKRHN